MPLGTRDIFIRLAGLRLTMPPNSMTSRSRKYQYMAKDTEGRDVFLADSGYMLQMAQQDFEHIKFHFTSEF